MVRKEFKDRRHPMESDVAIAFVRLMKKNKRGLPVSFSLGQVVKELVNMAEVGRSAPAVGALTEKLTEQLKESRGLFTGGALKYSEQTGQQYVPNSEDHFATYNGGVGFDWGAMSEDDVRRALPGSGRLTAGVSFFPVGSKHRMVWTSIHHKCNSADGKNAKTVDAVDRLGGSPESKVALRKMAIGFNTQYPKALPSPKATKCANPTEAGTYEHIRSEPETDQGDACSVNQRTDQARSADGSRHHEAMDI